MTEAALRYELYGLSGGNPYRVEPLDPLTHAGHRALLVDVNGYAAATEALGAYLQARAESGESAFVVVSGTDFTGRTSVANHVLDLHRQIRGLDRRLLVARVAIENNRAVEWVTAAMVELQNEIEKADLTLSPKLQEALDAIETIGATSGETIYPSRYRTLARRLRGELSGHPSGEYGFAAVFEGLRQADLIGKMQKVFEDSRSIAVFTHSAYKHANTPMLDELRSLGVHIVSLRSLDGPQIRCVAEARWKGASPLPSPFPPDSLEAVWCEPAPIKSVVKMLGAWIDFRLRTSSEQGAWPHNTDLEIGQRFMTATLDMLKTMGGAS
ncbi:hypothetical protein [Nonomuraea typhae]|uniref:hypothetical protein n=1 Tax=Nonomuraea typhae TaxID=2603600 RepID=UPI0012FBE16A|nr:hypothetical protein [Nonomuraea typhae]